jgi:multidrug efflux system membrane fusion protein
VYVVNADRTVGVRPVAVGVSHGEEASIDTGLSPDELVVVEGTEKLREGSKVEVQSQNGLPATGGIDQPSQGAEKPRRGTGS